MGVLQWIVQSDARRDSLMSPKKVFWDSERQKFYASRANDQAKRRTKARAHRAPRRFLEAARRKKISLSLHPQDLHDSSTGFPQAGAVIRFLHQMRNSALRAAVLVALLGAPARAWAADEPTLLRVFLKDGTSLVSFGEPARVGDRVVFSMPTTATPNPPLHLINLSADRVDWDRTNRYAATARAAHYVRNQAEND